MKDKIERLLQAGFELKASDIHITVGVPPVMRINGDLRKYGKESLLPEDTEEMAKAIIPEKMWERFKEQGELDFSYGIPLPGKYLSSKRLCINGHSNRPYKYSDH